MNAKSGRESLLWSSWIRQLKRHPRQIVLIDAATGAKWSARAITDAALRFSEPLFRHHAGERIAFRLPNGPEWMALFLALQREGLVAVPLDGAMPKEGCLETARRLGASSLYLDGKFQVLKKKTTARKTRVCCVKITSGSGALPKAIECHAEHLLVDGRNIIKTMGIRKGDIHLAVIPLGHSYGLGNLVMPLILQGTAMVCAGDYVPRQLVEWIGRYHVTVFPTVPALVRVMTALGPGMGKIDSLRTVISAGAPLTPAVAKAFFERFGRKVHNFYGSSETGGICYDRTGSASLTGRSVGKALVGVKVAVKAGRVVVASSAVAVRGGKWRLSDFGEWNKRGELVLLGRAGQEANIGGKKVHPLEIQRLLLALSGVSDAAVWLRQVGERDVLVAAVETKKTRAAIERALAAQLPAWKLPKTYFVARDLPRSERGKLDLAALKKL